MQSEPKRETVVTTWRATSIGPQEDSTQDGQGFVASHVDTSGLNSVWHSTANHGSWSITEALATICAGIFAVSQNRAASVQVVVPSHAQAVLVASLLNDLGRSDINVSMASIAASHGSGPRAIIVSLPSSEQMPGNNYADMVWEALRHDARPGVDDVISVGNEPFPCARGPSHLMKHYQRSSDAFGLNRLTDRGDLIQRLRSFFPDARKELLQLHSSQDVEDIPVVMRLPDWSSEKVTCLCGPTLPPILAGFACRFPDDTNILTNSPSAFEQDVATSKSLAKMRDFDEEAFLCTSRQWLLVEPELGKGGNHKSATLLMHAPSTALFLVRLAVGNFDTEKETEKPAANVSRLQKTNFDSIEQESALIENATPVQPDCCTVVPSPEQDTKKHRCRRYKDLYDKRLREVVARLSPREIEALFSSLESRIER